MPTSVEIHKQIVQKFLESKAVDFAAAGRVIAEIGPSVSLMQEPGDFFCGTMRTFFHCYRLPHPTGPIENLGELSQAVNEL